ncbi:MAG TPA: hypothetical protein VGJ84_05640 [Polyangiaceae bacterium]
MYRTTLPQFVLAAALLWSCGTSKAAPWLNDDPGPGCESGAQSEQRYGTACLCCHADEFSVAGSVERSGAPAARVVVTDSTGVSVDMSPNSFGNFFRHLKLTAPLTSIVYGPDGGALAMQSAAPSGDCNACHRAGGLAPKIHGPE